jgi:sulfiredoxin
MCNALRISAVVPEGHTVTPVSLLLQIDVLLVEGQYYGFSGCHRFEAHQRLGLPTIKCRVRKANKQVLKMHMM